MIFLDTNYLIALVIRDVVVNHDVTKWIGNGETIQTSAVAWAEFLTRPVGADDLRRLEALLNSQIVPFHALEAECARQLYRDARCKRDQRLDSFIAATAIVAGGSLATRNVRDFARFVPFGLKLA